VKPVAADYHYGNPSGPEPVVVVGFEPTGLLWILSIVGSDVVFRPVQRDRITLRKDVPPDDDAVRLLLALTGAR
jgi:hypothetical protein